MKINMKAKVEDIMRDLKLTDEQIESAIGSSVNFKGNNVGIITEIKDGEMIMEVDI